ncbi:YitT family protein [Bhargavaea ullalensis]|uniref:Membrane protein YczE n=1 Tax=Bhargavaea ullalensis TaxID=1265685 RepID=A0ABV2G7R9_9BACL
MRYLFYASGIFILTFGISLTIRSDFGTSPFDAMLVGLSRNVGLTVGSWEILIALALIGTNSLLSRQRPELLGLVTALITGAGIDLWLFLLNGFHLPVNGALPFLGFFFGMLFIGFGNAVYLHTNFAPVPVDRLTLIIRKMVRPNLFMARTLIYALFLAFALAAGGPIGIGTVLTVCFGGLLLNFFAPYAGKWINPLLQRHAQNAKDPFPH